MFKTILVPIDGSTGSERILLYAEHLARRDQAQVIILHAYELPDDYGWTEDYADLAAAYERIAAQVVQDAVDAVQQALQTGAGGEPVQATVTSDVRQGSAVDAILDAARVHAADLIVMGSRKRTGDNVTEALLGSVSSAVLLRTYCPVLVVP